MKNEEIKNKGISFYGLLTILLIGLKLTGPISWSWLWVLAPQWVPVAIALVLVVIISIAEAVKSNG